MIYITIGLGVLLLVIAFAAFNLLRKVEKYEDAVEKQSVILSQLYQSITNSNQRLQQIDERGIFEADDEIGWFFNSVQNMQNELNEFIKQEDAQEKVQS